MLLALVLWFGHEGLEIGCNADVVEVDRGPDIRVAFERFLFCNLDNRLLQRKGEAGGYEILHFM